MVEKCSPQTHSHSVINLFLTQYQATLIVCKILGKIQRENAGVVFLQETHLSEPDHAKLKRRGFNQVFSASYKSGPRRGVSVMIADKFNFEVQFEIKDNEGRYVMVGGRLEGIEVTFLNVYTPPGANWSEKKPWARWIHS